MIKISKKSSELAVALEDVKKHENMASIRENNTTKENDRLQQWQRRLYTKQAKVDEKEAKNKEDEYTLYFNMFSKIYCKDQIKKHMEKTIGLILLM